MNVLSRLEKRWDIWFLLCLSFVFFLLRLPSLFEPYWYGDEGIYEVLGEAMRAGRMLYTQAWDNKPPLLYVMYMLFGADQAVIRFVSLLFGLATLIAFFWLAKKLFTNSVISVVTTIVFAVLFAVPLLEGNIANAENFMLLFSICAANILLTYTSQHRHQRKGIAVYNIKLPIFDKLFLAGLILGIGFLLKIVILFDAAAFLFFLFLITLPKQLSVKQLLKEWKSYTFSFLKQRSPFFLGFFIPFGITVIYFLFSGALLAYLQAAFFSNIGYVGYYNDFLIPQGLLIIKVVLLLLAIALLVHFRSRLPRHLLFIFTWTVFSLFSLFFSARPYTHYLLVSLPVFSLSTSFFFLRGRFRLVLSVALIVVTFYLTKHFTLFGYKKTVLYYGNFISYVTNHKSTEDYQAFFDPITPRDYIVAQFLRLHTEPHEIVYLWGNSAQIYFLSHTLPPGRFAVEYHVVESKQNMDETNVALQKTKPKYIITFPGVQDYPFSLDQYKYIVTVDNTNIYERNN